MDCDDGKRKAVRSIFKNVYLTIIFRIIVGGLLLWTGYLKISHPWSFYEQIQAYQLLPDRMSMLLAFFIPVWELVLGMCLILRIWLRESAGAAFILFAVFTIAIMSALLRGLSVECGCFGFDGPMASWLSVLRNVALMGMLAYVFFGPSDQLKS